MLPRDNVYPRSVSSRNGVTFLDDQRLLVHDVIFDNHRLSSRESPDISSSFRLQVSVFDAKSGKSLLTREWGTRAHESSIQSTSGGLVVQTGEILRFLSKDLTEQKEVLMREMAEHSDEHWSEAVISVSPSRRTFMINRFNQGANVSRLDVFDGDTFQERLSWIESPPLYHSYSISDNGIVAVNMPEQKGILYAEFGGVKWRPLADAHDGACDLRSSFTGLLTFSSNEQLLIGAGGQTCVSDTHGHSEALPNIEGPTICASRAPFNEKIATSQDGRFIAISLAQVKIKKHTFAEASQTLLRRCVDVYDLSARKWLATIDLTPLPKNDYDFALSPDGSKLAILNDLKVSVYSVPAR